MIYIFILAIVATVVAVGLHEYEEQEEQVDAVKKETLREFSYWISFYEKECVNSYWAITDEEVKFIQSELDKLANKLACFYPGFTAPRLV
jgi:hypothetical protein